MMSTEFLSQPTLEGPTLTLRPLGEDDLEPLYRAANDPLIWAQHPSSDRYERPVFEKWFAEALTAKSLVIIDHSTGEMIGSSRFYEWDPDKREVAIGYTFITREYWGGTVNAELKTLMLDYAFVNADLVWFHVAAANLRSQKALAKIGAHEHHRQKREINGALEDYVYFTITATDWRDASD
ncbi:Putative acetyltransferase [Mycobacteroides abscessus subsp. abscessus]|uniref:GNAT family N-acetyltransferase n=1 Tax=Mycobacteroides abscessus TaxID=36809 RepID=UPI000928C7DD|nr:GNAT family N-acetyltransferase [Mycobacteroides abscessus]SIL49985.1 Putative acetyltransferase [Mycobacteroides abscessus subsp. abscessus]SLE82279.1 Putative acetyltransferase [Mycobacteroides abscessus subsp. abscessus]